MLLSKFMYFIHLHHICGINRETGVSQGSRSQSRQDTPSVTAAMSSYPAGAAAGYCFLLVSSFFFLLSSLSCRRSRRILFPTRFFFLLLSSSSSSSSFFWQHIFFTHFPTSYFDQTWSQWPVPWPLLRHKRWWGQGSPWGHWGQKGHLHQKGIKSFRLRSIDTGLMHMQ